MRPGLLLGATLLIASAAIATQQMPLQALRSPDSFAAIVDPTERSRAIFGEMTKVIQSPRCLNCHPAKRQPFQRNLEPHRPQVDMNVQSGALACQSCHHEHNTPTFAGGVDSIPGAEGWQLAPESMAWVGQTPRQICEELKDPERNGSRDLPAIQKHMAEDHLVGWAWHPGGSRPPAPGTQAQFGDLAAAWIATGAACPTD